MLPSRRHLFQGRPCIFQQDNAKTTFCTHYKVLAAEEEGTGTWLACLQSRPVSNRECVRILKRKMRQRRLRTVAHLKTCLQEEWDKITPETLHHLVSSVPKRLLRCCEKEWQHYKVVNALLSQLFLECVCRSEWQERMYIYKWHEVDQTKHEIFCVHHISAMKYKSK